MHQAFLYFSLLSMHEYDVEMTILRFCGGLEHKAMTFFFFSYT